MKFHYNFGYGEIEFDSRGETIIALLMHTFGLVKKFQEKINLHVPVNDTNEASIDFLVEGKEKPVLIEYHTLSQSDRIKGLSLEQSIERKKNYITKPELKEYDIFFISQLKQIYPVIRNPNIKPMVKSKYKKISGSQEDRYVKNVVSLLNQYNTKESRL